MLKFLKRILFEFKEYFLLVVLLLISISLLSTNEKQQSKHLNSFALQNFAIFSEAVNSLTSIIRKDPSLTQLKEENAELMLEVNRLRKYSLENEHLRGMIGLRDSSKYQLQPVQVVSKLVTKIQGNFIIDKGANDGIIKGMPVISEKGLVGLIMETTDKCAVVRTLNNSNLNVAVTVQRINVDGVLTYDGIDLIIKNIPTSQDVQIGDRVETSDFSSLFPASVPIGQVTVKKTNEVGLLYSLIVKPFADISGANSLFVIKIVPSKEINNLEMNLMK
jgi:rod shape-determining protein MreC